MNAHTLETPGQKQDKENDHDNDGGRVTPPARVRPSGHGSDEKQNQNDQ